MYREPASCKWFALAGRPRDNALPTNSHPRNVLRGIKGTHPPELFLRDEHNEGLRPGVVLHLYGFGRLRAAGAVYLPRSKVDGLTV